MSRGAAASLASALPSVSPTVELHAARASNAMQETTCEYFMSKRITRGGALCTLSGGRGPRGSPDQEIPDQLPYDCDVTPLRVLAS